MRSNCIKCVRAESAVFDYSQGFQRNDLVSYSDNRQQVFTALKFCGCFVFCGEQRNGIAATLRLLMYVRLPHPTSSLRYYRPAFPYHVHQYARYMQLIICVNRFKIYTSLELSNLLSSSGRLGGGGVSGLHVWC